MASEPKNLAEALVHFYGKVGTIHEDAKAQYGAYADLSSVLSVVNPALAKSGLAITQTFEDTSEAHFLITTLHHRSGEKQTSTTKLVTGGGRGNPLHTWGGSVTYQRRYALLSMLNLAAGIEDNDGDHASAPAQQQQQQKPVKKAAAKPVVVVRKDAPPVVEEVAKAFAEAVDGEIITPVQTPAKQDPEPVSDPEGPLSPELQKELVDGTIPALPGDYVEAFCKAFAVQFKTGNKKIRNCFTHYKHYTWTQDYFAKHPLEPVEVVPQ